MSLDLFLQNPRGFASQNIIFPPSRGSNVNGFNDPNSHRQSGVFEFAFVTSNYQGKTANGEPCSCYMIEKADNWNTKWPRFKSYFCFYEPDEMHILVVDKAADIMLTPTMNGCSFGVGSATETGARLVSHVNESPVQGKQVQAVNQAEMLKAGLGTPDIMGPDTYMTKDNIRGTTIGFRRNGQWSFFMQNWKQTGNEYKLKIVRDIN
jgi:hypothetical protein